MIPTLGQRALIAGCHRGRVRRTTTGYDLWDKPGAVMAARVNKRIDELAAAGWVQLGSDGKWRPTQAGAEAAGITERTSA